MRTLDMLLSELEAMKALHGGEIEVCFNDYEQGLTDITSIEFEEGTASQRHTSFITIN